MGFGAIIAAAFGLALIIISAYTVLGGIYFQHTTLADSMKELQNRKNEQLRTSVKIESAKKEVNYVYLNLSNTGSTKIREFQRIDVIAANTTTGSLSYLNYENGSLSMEEWNFTLYKDYINPGLLDPGEGMNITLLTNTNPNVVWFGTPSGIVTSSHTE